MVPPKSSGTSGPPHRLSPERSQQPATEPAAVGIGTRRRAVAMAGHTGDLAAARHGLTDPAPSVRVTALGALDRLHALDEHDLAAVLADDDPSVRRRGCELAATHTVVDLAPMLDDPDPTVVEMAAWSLGEQGDRASVRTLASLASTGSGHRDPLCREAAVAALGAIGDPSGKQAVLAALADKPAIRRRATAALAAFDGADVEAALRRCLEDRDWQVRQVAEDLLAVE